MNTCRGSKQSHNFTYSLKSAKKLRQSEPKEYLIFFSSFTDPRVGSLHGLLGGDAERKAFPGSNTATACGEQLMETQRFAGNRRNAESEQCPGGAHTRQGLPPGPKGNSLHAASSSSRSSSSSSSGSHPKIPFSKKKKKSFAVFLSLSAGFQT